MADTRINFTKRALEALPLPEEGKRKYYYDTQIRALAICVQSSGAKSFYVCRRVKGVPKKILVGPFPDLSVEQARKKAETLNASIAQGEDPTEATKAAKAEWTFGELFKWYIETHAKPNKRSWVRDEDRHGNHLKHLDAYKLSDITRTMVRQLHVRIGQSKSGIYEANRVLALLRVIFNKAIAYEVFAGPNPAEGISMFKERSRNRRLTSAEIPKLLKALEEEQDTDLRDFIRLLLLTGARRSNVQAMAWRDVDFEARLWKIPQTKNGEPQLIPLGPIELELLKQRRMDVGGPWVFPAKSKTGHMVNPHKRWVNFLKRAKIEDFHLHDLRRTLGSVMADTGASLHIIGKTLGHLHPSTTEVYARLATDPILEAKYKAIQAMYDIKPDEARKIVLFKQA
jgi:integrase